MGTLKSLIRFPLRMKMPNLSQRVISASEKDFPKSTFIENFFQSLFPIDCYDHEHEFSREQILKKIKSLSVLCIIKSSS